MLMMIGPVQCEVWPFNPTSYEHQTKTDYVWKPIAGAAEIPEFVGEGAETWRVTVKLFPKKLGGLAELSVLQSARSSAQPQFFMRGDGVPLGWVAITDVQEKSTYLDRQGVGQVIEVEISMRSAEQPDPGSFFSLFGG